MQCPVSDILASYGRIAVSYPDISMNGAKGEFIYSVFPNPRLMVSASLVGGWQAAPVQR